MSRILILTLSFEKDNIKENAWQRSKVVWFGLAGSYHYSHLF